MAARTARGRSSTPRGRSSSGHAPAPGRARGGRPRDPAKEVERLLKAGKKEWDASKDEVDNIGADNRVPAGTYEIKLVKLTLLAKDDKLSIMRKHMVTDGEYQGDTITDFMRFTSDNGAVSKAYIRRYFETLEVDVPEDPSELPALVEDLTKEGYEGKLRCWYTEGRDRKFLNAELLEAYPVDDNDKASGDAATEDAPTDQPTETGSPDDAAPAGDGGEKSLDDMDKDELVKVIEDEKIPVKGIRRKGVDKLREEIRAYDEAQNVGDGEPAAPDAPAEDAEDLKTLAAFCKAQGIKVSDDDKGSAGALCKLIAKYEYDSDKLDKEDIALLEKFKLGELVIEPEPPAPAARRSRRR